MATPVRDRQEHLVAIEKNHWSVTPACLDKNYTENSLEVFDARGLVVFQMRLLADYVELQGEWRDEFGNGVRFAEEPRILALQSQLNTSDLQRPVCPRSVRIVTRIGLMVRWNEEMTDSTNPWQRLRKYEEW